MRLKQKLPVSYLLFTFRGRIGRATWWNATLFIWLSFYVLFHAVDAIFGYTATLVLYPVLFYSVAATGSKRLHDTGLRGYWLLTALIPVAGPLWLTWRLGFRKSLPGENEFGTQPGIADDYLCNPDPDEIASRKPEDRWINDVTQLNPILVSTISVPSTVDELAHLVKNSTLPIAVGGGRFSMGGQTATHMCHHISTRKLNRILELDVQRKIIRVETGIRWCDIQEAIDPHNLSVKIMQTYANFSVGGSLSVNVHGRYIGLGPLILSVRSIDIVLADGSIVHATPGENQEIFFGAIGGYGGIGIIVRAEFDLADNVAVKRTHLKMKTSQYRQFFFDNVRDQKSAVFHNGDLYPPHFKRIHGVTWSTTHERPTVKTRLMPLKDSYPVERYFLWAFTETMFGMFRREYLIEPLVYLRKRIHWRNYEAGYDVAELEPTSRAGSTYVLQEYFAPVDRFDEFVEKMAEIFQRNKVKVVNVSVRHALPDPGSIMSWAREEVFAFVVYYKQNTDKAAREAVARWTRELIEAAIGVGGTYYLPYQAHATQDQFMRAYPNAKKMFELKSRLDPDYKFRNVIWDTYYQPLLQKK